MVIQEFDKVQLKDGKTAYIVEIFEQGKEYLADIDIMVDGAYYDSETEMLCHKDIEKIIG